MTDAPPRLLLDPILDEAQPDGQGKEAVEGGCNLCHGLDRVADARRSSAHWQSVVKRMVFLGAPLNGDQAKAAVEYLSANYGLSKTASTR